ncbi:MAG: nucleotidyltransferase domain-containing protein [Bacteroidales bacterium]|nr:nucleotidyltransferase domain-containing protein [Bacteroidales bacterium]
MLAAFLFIFIIFGNMYYKENELLSLIKTQVSHKDPDAEIVLFGSRARGDAKIESDWDILILLNVESVSRQMEKMFREAIFEVELQTGEGISTFVFSKNEWDNKHAHTPFYENIKREGVLIS